VCARNKKILVNTRLAARRLRRDPHGRLLPWWRGCVTLKKGALILLNKAPDSFDGRYFGPSELRDIVGRAKLLWAV
jgi:type IV secretory pathway protease TraF